MGSNGLAPFNEAVATGRGRHEFAGPGPESVASVPSADAYGNPSVSYYGQSQGPVTFALSYSASTSAGSINLVSSPVGTVVSMNPLVGLPRARCGQPQCIGVPLHRPEGRGIPTHSGSGTGGHRRYPEDGAARSFGEHARGAGAVFARS